MQLRTSQDVIVLAQIAPFVFALTWDALRLLKNGAAFSGQMVRRMCGALASSEPYKDKVSCRIEIPASRNTRFGDWGVSMSSP